jgi:hypothetical protein
MRVAISLLLLALAACSAPPDLREACDRIEPYRPLIRGVITAVEPVAAVPFAVTRQVSCADAEAVVQHLRDQR